jgi:transposase
MILSYSRYRFVRFVFRQDVPSWIDCHRRALEFFGGVPRSVVLDNLKPAVVKADIYAPVLTRVYAALKRYYGFVVDSAKVAWAKMKGKVERGVPAVGGTFWQGRRSGTLTRAMSGL